MGTVPRGPPVRGPVRGPPVRGPPGRAPPGAPVRGPPRGPPRAPGHSGPAGHATPIAGGLARAPAAPRAYVARGIVGGAPYVLADLVWTPSAGKLDITAKEGRLAPTAHHRGPGSLPDPYVTFHIPESRDRRTKASTKKKRNTLTPRWEERLSLSGLKPTDVIQVDVLDMDVGPDEWMGTGVIKVGELPPGPSRHQIQISHKRPAHRQIATRPRPRGLVHGNWPAPSFVPLPLPTTPVMKPIGPNRRGPPPPDSMPPMVSPDQTSEPLGLCPPQPCCPSPPPRCASPPPCCPISPRALSPAPPSRADYMAMAAPMPGAMRSTSPLPFGSTYYPGAGGPGWAETPGAFQGPYL